VEDLSVAIRLEVVDLPRADRLVAKRLGFEVWVADEALVLAEVELVCCRRVRRGGDLET
jgi:hypothetical protein